MRISTCPRFWDTFHLRFDSRLLKLLSKFLGGTGQEIRGDGLHMWAVIHRRSPRHRVDGLPSFRGGSENIDDLGTWDTVCACDDRGVFLAIVIRKGGEAVEDAFWEDGLSCTRHCDRVCGWYVEESCLKWDEISLDKAEKRDQKTMRWWGEKNKDEGNEAEIYTPKEKRWVIPISKTPFTYPSRCRRFTPITPYKQYWKAQAL